MIEVLGAPRNREHFTRLIAFTREVLAVCDEVGIRPVLNGSLTVFAYTQDRGMEIHDVDLSCSESLFPLLRNALREHGFSGWITDWHVLQTRRDDLKVEFDSSEYWMAGIPPCYETVVIGDLRFQAISLDGLRELYQRGLVATAPKPDAHSRAQHRAISEKLSALDRVRS